MYFKQRNILALFFIVQMPFMASAKLSTWTGYGGDSLWSNAQNWSAGLIPDSTDDVMLDNGIVPFSYRVYLPDVAVSIKTIRISPSPGYNIELILPPTNNVADAFSVKGPGYGIELNTGAIFRNSSGISSGESMKIGDSIIIYNGGHYIHQTRASHANDILNHMSVAPGTEEGIFEFNVPRASYTISVSNRIYGTLILNSQAYGSTVNYTCAGSNPVLIRGNLYIGRHVQMSMNLNGSNANVQVEGDLIQEGGLLNLATGTNSTTIFHVRGDLSQASDAIITSSDKSNPFFELNGGRQQAITMNGKITGPVGFRLNNLSGAWLKVPLKLPWILSLQKGRIITSQNCLLTLDSNCKISVDSNMTGCFIDGPIRKLGLNNKPAFLFPVGKDGHQRWLELKNANGSLTIEYIHENPFIINPNITSDLDHISKVEYWKVYGESNNKITASAELSFSSDLSGGVTDPAYLDVAELDSDQWVDIGHSAFTGNSIVGSVTSNPIIFDTALFTLSSKVELENPLPTTIIKLNIHKENRGKEFNWNILTSTTPIRFELYEKLDGISILLTKIAAKINVVNYYWSQPDQQLSGTHYYYLKMIDNHDFDYISEVVDFNDDDAQEIIVRWIMAGPASTINRFLLKTNKTEVLNYKIFTSSGSVIEQGNLTLSPGESYLKPDLPAGLYIFSYRTQKGKLFHLPFICSN